jgi:hypothetical protein
MEGGNFDAIVACESILSIVDYPDLVLRVGAAKFGVIEILCEGFFFLRECVQLGGDDKQREDDDV